MKRMTKSRSWVAQVTFMSLGLGVLGCEALTRAEAKEAVEEAQLYSQAASLIGNTLEVTENFTIGAAVEAAAENLREFYVFQLPCAEVSLTANSLLVEYGANGDDCVHNGMTFTGTHEVTISKNDEDQVIVDHVWTDLENGTMNVSGTAHVTWSGGDDPSRRVEHDLSWTRLSDGREAHGSGERVQRPLGGDLRVGFQVSGDAKWEGESGTWDLTISDVEMRFRDPIPQAGEYFLETPFNKSLSVSFERVSSDEVRVTASSGRRSYDFDVTTPE